MVLWQIGIISKKLSVDASSIKADVERIIEKNIRAYKSGEGLKARQSALGYQDKVNPDFAKAPAVAKHEEAILALLLIYPEHRKTVFGESLLSESDLNISLIAEGFISLTLLEKLYFISIILLLSI